MLKISEERKLEIARVAHEVNAAYCRSIGDDSQLSWDDASDELKASCLAGVTMNLENSEATPESNHESWMKERLENDWILGDEKSEELKTHPLLIPYDELPVEQRAKDYIFKALINSMSTMPEVKVAEKVVTEEVGMTPVRYIGKRERYTDGMYRTGLTWDKGETLMVPTEKANMLLTHKDQYERGGISKIVPGSEVKTKKAAKKSAKKKETETSEEECRQEARDMINQMQDVAAVKDYAFKNFAGKKLHHNIGLVKAKADVLVMIDQFGVE